MNVDNRARAPRRIPVWGWAGLGLGAAAGVVLIPPVVVIIATVVLVTALVGIASGRPTWLRLESRGAAGLVLAVSVVALAVAAPLTASLGDADGTRAAATRDREHFSSADRARQTPTPTPTPTPVVTTVEEVVVEAIAFERSSDEDPALPKGEVRVSPGTDGQRHLTYRVTLTDGVESARELVGDVIAVAPVTEVTTVGTYVAPQPPPQPAPAPPSGCDPNYADACVPIDSDVDCAGGSGNGPSYFSGVARVVGVDIYDLDRDNDGYACEP